MFLELCFRVLATALFDWALALGCGCLLTAFWCRDAAAPLSVDTGLRLTSVLMTVALCAQMYLLTMSLTGFIRPYAVVASVPAVAGTHAGTVTLAMLVVSGLLSLVSAVAHFRLRTALQIGLIVCVLALHSATGHSAAGGDFTLTELLQFLHLCAMAVWTGGVVTTGLLVAPQLQHWHGHCRKSYLRRLSWTSTWAVMLVSGTGAIKGYSGIEGDLQNMTGSAWGRILLLKVGLAFVALGLGFVHRRWIHSPQRDWETCPIERFSTTIRLEALCLTLIVLLSAWLASTEPASALSS